MPYDGKLLAQAREALEQRRADNAAEQQRRLSLVYARDPEIEQIDLRLRRQMAELVRLTLSRRSDLTERIEELKKENREYEQFLSDLSTEQRNFLENYMDIVDHAHFQEQQRAYYQGIVDAVQILAGLGIVKESVKVKELLNTIMK